MLPNLSRLEALFQHKILRVEPLREGLVFGCRVVFNHTADISPTFVYCGEEGRELYVYQPELCEIVDDVGVLALAHATAKGITANMSISSTVYEATQTLKQDPFHRDVTATFENGITALVNQHNISRQAPTFYATDASVRRALEIYTDQESETYSYEEQAAFDELLGSGPIN